MSATTVERIAEAMEVSPSRFFRYFPSKEDLVVRSGYDSPIVSALRGIAPGAPPVDAFRRAVRAAFEGFDPDDLARASARTRLALSVPPPCPRRGPGGFRPPRRPAGTRTTPRETSAG
jgi:AcrR family transcriptional regulator